MDDTKQFEADMDAAGFDVEHYHGRAMWHGPAVRTDEMGSDRDLQAVIRATTVTVQWDTMGSDLIVYPRAGDPTSYVSCSRANESDDDDSQEGWS